MPHALDLRPVVQLHDKRLNPFRRPLPLGTTTCVIRIVVAPFMMKGDRDDGPDLPSVRRYGWRLASVPSVGVHAGDAYA